MATKVSSDIALALRSKMREKVEEIKRREIEEALSKIRSQMYEAAAGITIDIERYFSCLDDETNVTVTLRVPK